MIIAASNAEAGFGEAIEMEKNTSNDFDVLESFTLAVGYTSAISVGFSWHAQEGAYKYKIQYREVGEYESYPHFFQYNVGLLVCPHV